MISNYSVSHGLWSVTESVVILTPVLFIHTFTKICLFVDSFRPYSSNVIALILTLAASVRLSSLHHTHCHEEKHNCEYH